MRVNLGFARRMCAKALKFLSEDKLEEAVKLLRAISEKDQEELLSRNEFPALKTLLGKS